METQATLSPVDSSGKRSWAMQRWHVDNVVVFPHELELFDDVPRLFEEHVLVGHVPARPLLRDDDAVITLGSCFADELRNFLDAAGFSSASFWVPSGLNNTFALVDFVSWCTNGQVTSRAYRYERLDDGEIGEWTPEGERQEYEKRFREAGCFVFTLGLAEVWEDSETHGVFWRGVPQAIFDASRHVFRLSTVAENEENIVNLIRLIREVNETAPIVLTLSPVPLRATFRDISCVSADAVSKSVLRVALNSVMERQLPGVFYWPSFELVKWAGPVLDSRAYDDPDARHVNRYLVYTIVSAFVRAFYGEEAAARFAAKISTAGMAEKPPHRTRALIRRGQRLATNVRRRAAKRAAQVRQTLA
jgi:GSCFA family